MPSQEDIDNQQKQLSIHRRNLTHYLEQKANLGGAYVPPGVANGIREARENIHRIKATLHSWNIAVEDHPDDDTKRLSTASWPHTSATLGQRYAPSVSKRQNNKNIIIIIGLILGLILLCQYPGLISMFLHTLNGGRSNTNTVMLSTEEARSTSTSLRSSSTAVMTADIENTASATAVGSTLSRDDTLIVGDDFEDAIDPMWGLVGENFTSVNGLLVASEDGFFRSSLIENVDKLNYRVTIQNVSLAPGGSFKSFFRMQDRDNYILLECKGETGVDFGGGYSIVRCYWYKTVDGNLQAIPESQFDAAKNKMTDLIIEVEIEDAIYRSFIDREQRMRFVDNTYATGGYTFEGKGVVKIDAITIRKLN